MKRRSSFRRAAARETQAWFVIGLCSGGLAFTIWLSFADPTGKSEPATSLLGVVACFFLSYAVPYAAIRISEWERDGRLDQLRLSGQPPLSLLIALGIPAATPWAISGGLYLAAGAWLGGVPPYWPQIVLLVAGAGVTVSVLALSLPRSPHITDFRIVMVAAGLYAGLLSAIATNSDAPMQGLLAEYLLSHPSRIAALIALDAVVIAWRFPQMLARLARPQPPRSRVVVAPRPPLIRLPMPAVLKRGASIGLVAALALTIFVLLIVTAVLVAGRRPEADAAIAAAFLPWIVGAVVISTTSRSDAETGKLDVLRLSRWPSAFSAIRMTMDMWMPFFAGMAVIAMVFAVVGRTSPTAADFAHAMLVAILVAPMALLEGWHRGLMLTYLLPTLLGAIALIPSSSRFTLEALLTTAAVIWIPWGMVAAALRRGIGVPLDRRFAMLAAAAVLVAGDWAAASMRILSSPGTTVMLLVIAAWLDDGKRSWRTVWTLPALVLAIGVLLRARFDDQISAALAALLPAIGLLCALRIHHAFVGHAQPWSIAVRMLLAVFLATLDSAAFRVLVTPRMRDPGSIAQVDFIEVYRISVVGAIVVLAATTLLVEPYARWRGATPRP